MGVRIVSSSRVHGLITPVVQRMFDTHRVGSAVSVRPNALGTPGIQVHYDGSANKNGCPSGLNANVGVVDTQSLMRNGTNLGITASYTNGGAGTCLIEGCNASREVYTRLFSSDPTESADAATQLAASPWVTLGTADAATPVQTEFKVFSMLRFTFTDGTPASIVLASR